MNQQQFLARAKAGETVYLIEKLELSEVTLKIGNDILPHPFSNPEAARNFGRQHGLNPFTWQAVSDTSYYKAQP